MTKINLQADGMKSLIGSSKLINLSINGKKSHPEITAVINPWGVKKEQLGKKENFSASIKEKAKFLEFNVEIGDVETKGYIAGYPSIIIGQSPWWPSADIKFGKISDYKKIEISTEFDFITKNNANFTYDVWLDKSKEKGLAKNSVEIMVWLDYKFTPPWESLGEFGGFNVLYKKKGEEFYGGSHVFAFFSKTKDKKISFDLKELADFCKKKVKDIKDYNLKSIELGTEFPKNSKIQAKLYKLDITIQEK